MARTFVRDHRPAELLLQVHTRAVERRSHGEAEDVGRDHSARPPVNFRFPVVPSAVSRRRMGGGPATRGTSTSPPTGHLIVLLRLRKTFREVKRFAAVRITERY